jgi:two-component system response regulator FlrC
MEYNDHQMPATSVKAGSPTDDELARAVRVLAGKLDLRSLERLYILQTLATVNGSRRAAVERLGISERTLRNKLQQYRLDAVIRSA